MIDDATKKKVQLLNWLKEGRTNAEETVQEISDLCMPYRGDITTRNTPGTRRKPLFDSEAVIAAEKFTNFLNGSLFPASSAWINSHVISALTNPSKVEKALEDTNQRMLQALSDSNFYVEANTWGRDWGVLGSGTLYEEHDDGRASNDREFGGLVFEALPWSRVWWQFGTDGKPLVIARQHDMPAIEAKKFFSRPKDKNQARLNEVVDRQPYEDVELVHIIERNPDGKPGTDNKPWRTTWLLMTGQNAILRESGMDVLRYIPSRMMVMDKEQYGRGRGHIARPMAKGVNQIAKQELIALGKHINPPFMAEDDTIVSLDFAPGGHLVVRPPREMQPGYLKSGTDFQLVELIKENYKKDIREAFFSDALDTPETQERSATATRDRQETALARLASTSQTVIYEMLNPMMAATMDIMLSKGALPELKEVMNEDPGFEFDITFTSPFFTAMKSQSAIRVFSTLERRLQLFERTSDPAWLEDINPDGLRKFERDMTDAPSIIFHDEETIEAKRSARADKNTDESIAALAGRAERSQTQVRLQPGGRGGRVGGGIGAGLTG